MRSIPELKEVFSYDEYTGIFRWKIKPNRRIQIGALCESIQPTTGYIKLVYQGITYQAHRVAWAFMTGEWPKKEIDHKDTNRVNNRWDNLREATIQQNSFNRTVRSDNSSGVKGVYFIPKTNKWAAAVWVDGKRNYLGSFTDLEAAKDVVTKERDRLHNIFANHG